MKFFFFFFFLPSCRTGFSLFIRQPFPFIVADAFNKWAGSKAPPCLHLHQLTVRAAPHWSQRNAGRRNRDAELRDRAGGGKARLTSDIRMRHCCVPTGSITITFGVSDAELPACRVFLGKRTLLPTLDSCLSRSILFDTFSMCALSQRKLCATVWSAPKSLSLGRSKARRCPKIASPTLGECAQLQ